MSQVRDILKTRDYLMTQDWSIEEIEDSSFLTSFFVVTLSFYYVSNHPEYLLGSSFSMPKEFIETKQSEEQVLVNSGESYEKRIINLIKHYFRGIEGYFTSVGKKSYAHYAAYGVHKKKKSANRIALAEEIMEIIKND